MKTKTKYPVLDDGFVRMEGWMGDDLSIVNHARISLARYKEVMDPSDEKLINFLMKNRHGTPFEAVHFSFHVRAPIFVAREWMRHRIASYNEMSARYVKMETDYYLPSGEFIRTQKGKPGSYRFEPIYDPGKEYSIRSVMLKAYNAASEAYEELLKLGLAKEVARNVLPVALYTEFYFDVNARALMNFLSLRNHSSALKEIQEYAKAIESCFAEVAPICYDCFVKNGRQAP